MSPYLVLETDDDKQKTDVADDVGESAAWTDPVRLSGNGPIKVTLTTSRNLVCVDPAIVPSSCPWVLPCQGASSEEVLVMLRVYVRSCR
jgi:hypothetical protein